MDETITIKRENAMAALELCDEKTKSSLQKLFGFENEPKNERPITERVTSWDDVLRELGENHPYVKSLPAFEKISEDDDENALIYHKLRMICEVLNEGWRPDFHDDEHRYYPWFYLYKAKKDVKKYACDDEYVFEIPEAVRACLLGGYSYIGSYAGLACSDSDSAPSYTYSNIGSRLCLKTRELALHAGKYFNELWLTYLFC